MKKFISLLAAIALCLPAFAAETEASDKEVKETKKKKLFTNLRLLKSVVRI